MLGFSFLLILCEMFDFPFQFNDGTNELMLEIKCYPQSYQLGSWC